MLWTAGIFFPHALKNVHRDFMSPDQSRGVMRSRDIVRYEDRGGNSRALRESKYGWLFRIRRSRFLLLLILSSFLIRAAAVEFLRNPSQGPEFEQMGADGIEFNTLGLHLAANHRYELTKDVPTSFRAPGLPFLLAVIYRSVGEKYRVVYGLFCLLGALTCLFAYFLARELLSEEWSRIASLLCTFYIPHIYFATIFASENVFAAALPAALWCMVRYFRRGGLKTLLAAGLILGYATLTRPFALIILPMWLALLLLKKGSGLEFRVAAPAMVLAGFLIVTAPWVARNYRVHHRFVVVATNGGSTFYGSNNSRVLSEPYDLGNWIPTTELPDRDLIDASPDEVSRDKLEWSLGFRWVRQHAVSMPLLCAFKLIRLWLPRIDTNNRNYFRAELFGYTPIGLLFLLAAIQTVRQRQFHSFEWAAVHATIAATVITAIVFYGSARFRDANAAILVLYASVGLQWIGSIFKAEAGCTFIKVQNGGSEAPAV